MDSCHPDSTAPCPQIRPGDHLARIARAGADCAWGTISVASEFDPMHPAPRGGALLGQTFLSVLGGGAAARAAVTAACTAIDRNAVDLATACGARLVRLGLSCVGERTASGHPLDPDLTLDDAWIAHLARVGLLLRRAATACGVKGPDIVLAVTWPETNTVPMLDSGPNSPFALVQTGGGGFSGPEADRCRVALADLMARCAAGGVVSLRAEWRWQERSALEDLDAAVALA